MLPFDLLFPDLAQRESIAIEAVDSRGRPEAMFVFRELYCPDRGCDCRRVMLQVSLAGDEKVVATIGYGFEPERAKRFRIPQIMLDPLNTQSELSETVLALFTQFLEARPQVRERFIEHYTMWKAAVNDPTRDALGRVRGLRNKPTLGASKQGFAPNQRCYCRSGKKFKNCCGRDSEERERDNARP